MGHRRGLIGTGSRPGFAGTADQPLPVPAIWWARQDSNLRPTDYESAALTD